MMGMYWIAFQQTSDTMNDQWRLWICVQVWKLLNLESVGIEQTCKPSIFAEQLAEDAVADPGRAAAAARRARRREAIDLVEEDDRRRRLPCPDASNVIEAQPGVMQPSCTSASCTCANLPAEP